MMAQLDVFQLLDKNSISIPCLPELEVSPGDVNRLFSDREMSKRFSSMFMVLPLLLTLGNSAQQSDPVIFTTQPKPAIARLISAEKISLEGRASFTVTKAEDDDTITGILVFTISDDERYKLAELSDFDPEEIPAKFSREDVTARFQKGTSCPTLHLEIPSVEMEAAGTPMRFDLMVLDIVETQQQMSQLFCAWSRQINARRHRRGIIAAINRLIKPEVEDREIKK
jgi:hypothetical protein